MDNEFEKVGSDLNFAREASNGIYVSGVVLASTLVEVSEQFGKIVKPRGKTRYCWHGRIEIGASGKVRSYNGYIPGLEVYKSGFKSWDRQNRERCNWKDEKLVHAAVREVVGRVKAEETVLFQAADRIDKMNGIIYTFNYLDSVDYEYRSAVRVLEELKEKRNKMLETINSLAAEVVESGKVLKENILKSIGEV